MNSRGFTLVELMITLAVAVILITVAFPAYRQMLLDNQRDRYSNDLLSTLNLARTEAVTRNQTVIICKSDDQASCDNSVNWNDGWLVYADVDGNGAFSELAGDVLLDAHEATTSSFTLTSEDFPNTVVYQVSGRHTRPATAVPHAFELCNTATEMDGRNIEITSTGRPRATVKTDCPDP